MIIIDERDFIEKQLEDKGFHVFDFYEDHQVMDVATFCKLPLQRRADMLLVDTATLLNHPHQLEQFRTIINTFLGVVFFHEHSHPKAQSWVEGEAAFLTKIVGEYSLPMPQLNWTMLSNQLQFFWSILQEQKELQKKLSLFSQELDKIMQQAEGEVSRARKIHETLIPKRNDEIKGVQFLSKYAVGDGGGGEFYDLIQLPHKVVQVIVSSESYLISSTLLGLLDQHKKKDFDAQSFMQEAKREINAVNSSKKKKSEVDLTVLELDLNQLILTRLGESKVELYSLNKGQLNLSSPYQLSKGEKIVVFSPGFIFNWKDVQPKKSVNNFLQENRLDLAELLPELFFHLRLDQESEFLKKDATVVMMEVKRHGMHQV